AAVEAERHPAAHAALPLAGEVARPEPFVQVLVVGDPRLRLALRLLDPLDLEETPCVARHQLAACTPIEARHSAVSSWIRISSARRESRGLTFVNSPS